MPCDRHGLVGVLWKPSGVKQKKNHNESGHNKYGGRVENRTCDSVLYYESEALIFCPRSQRKFPAIPKNRIRIAGFIRPDVLACFCLKSLTKQSFCRKHLYELVAYLKNSYTCLIKQWRINSKYRSTCNRRCFSMGVETPLGDT